MDLLCRSRRAQSRIVAAAGDAQHAALRSHAMTGPLRSHELESRGGIEPASRVSTILGQLHTGQSSATAC